MNRKLVSANVSWDQLQPHAALMRITTSADFFLSSLLHLLEVFVTDVSGHLLK